MRGVGTCDVDSSALTNLICKHLIIFINKQLNGINDTIVENTIHCHTIATTRGEHAFMTGVRVVERHAEQRGPLAVLALALNNVIE